jgi:hypothetical protein
VSIKIAIICDRSRWSAILQRIGVFFGTQLDCPEMPYHAAFYDTEEGRFYDMHVRFRKAPAGAYKGKTTYFFDPPVEIAREELEWHIGKHLYGVLDVLLYIPAKWFKLNLPGDHCSEVINDILRDCQAKTPWRFYADPPSPCELLKWAAGSLASWKKE